MCGVQQCIQQEEGELNHFHSSESQGQLHALLLLALLRMPMFGTQTTVLLPVESTVTGAVFKLRLP